MTAVGMSSPGQMPILRVPPFPGAHVDRIAGPASAPVATASRELAEQCAAAMRHRRVGGNFWAAQPPLPASRRLIAKADNSDTARAMFAQAQSNGLADSLLLWLPRGVGGLPGEAAFSAVIEGDCDPWHMFAHARMLWLDGDDEVALLARVAGVRMRLFDDGRRRGGRQVGGGKGRFADGDAATLVARHVLTGVTYTDPFSGSEISAVDAVSLLGGWRDLIDSNRAIDSAIGFARWKRDTVSALLWAGTDRVRFAPATAELLRTTPPGKLIAAWKSRVPAGFLAKAEASEAVLCEVEDGFIRSSGLGANCVPPLSIVVDRQGVHFDPSRSSDLESLIETADYTPLLLRQADALHALILRTGISKYETGTQAMARPGGDRHHILVPGQVEDDRSVINGGGDVGGNLELLRRVRAREPDAFILYKPHPDVEAGHRKGAVSDTQIMAYANAIVRDAPISALLDMVDSVHVLTSLAGFEALLRSKPVTTHGVPFYAGWGLTTDLGAVPARRTARRTLNELIAAVLMLYPRYLDPVTLLPCPPDVLIDRLSAGTSRQNETIVSLRRVQGALRRTFSRIGAAA